ncbi:hypothetical protein AB1Y20_017135 [Prymnesium parvum]|uniref:Uncharacterized protein n=1 Tax=Prymnesium parvum TaxID=97485 RepID=A0AB34ICQ1_PRYPA
MQPRLFAQHNATSAKGRPEIGPSTPRLRHLHAGHLLRVLPRNGEVPAWALVHNVAAIRSASHARKLGFQYMLLDKFEQGRWTGQVLGGRGARKRVFATIAERRLSPFRHPRQREGGGTVPAPDLGAPDFDVAAPDFGSRGALSP